MTHNSLVLLFKETNGAVGFVIDSTDRDYDKRTLNYGNMLNPPRVSSPTLMRVTHEPAVGFRFGVQNVEWHELSDLAFQLDCEEHLRGDSSP